MDEEEARKRLFGISETEKNEDIDDAVKNYKLPEISSVEDFILAHSKFFEDLKSDRD